MDTLDRSKPFFPVLETPARNIRECPHELLNQGSAVNRDREREREELDMVNRERAA